MDNFMTKKLFEFGFNTRAITALNAIGIQTVKELSSLSEDDLYRVKNIGRKTVNEIKEVLLDKNIYLGQVKTKKKYVPEKEGRIYGRICPKCNNRIGPLDKKCNNCFFDIELFYNNKKKIMEDIKVKRKQRNEQIVLECFEKDISFKSIGNKFGIGGQRVLQIFSRCMRNIRKQYPNFPHEDYYNFGASKFIKSHPEIKEIIIKHFTQKN